MEENWKKLCGNLGYKFEDKSILREALTHKSFLSLETEKKFLNNERLEFLGDAILDLILYSPYTPWSDSYIRKPRPGMLEVGRQIINAGENGEAVAAFNIAEM